MVNAGMIAFQIPADVHRATSIVNGAPTVSRRMAQLRLNTLEPRF